MRITDWNIDQTALDSGYFRTKDNKCFINLASSKTISLFSLARMKMNFRSCSKLSKYLDSILKKSCSISRKALYLTHDVRTWSSQLC